MTLDPNTLTLLHHQGQRMHKALHETIPPDRVEAAKIQNTVDNILDTRAHPIAVASDGEALLPGTSSWVVNQTGRNERVLPEDIEREVRSARQRLGVDGDDDGGLVGASR